MDSETSKTFVLSSIDETANPSPCKSDAAFKKEAEDGYSLRGALLGRGGCRLAEALTTQQEAIHVLDWVCKTQLHVTRSTFAAELVSGSNE